MHIKAHIQCGHHNIPDLLQTGYIDSMTGNLNSLTACAAYIRVFIFYEHIKYRILNMLKIKRDINQQDLKRVDCHFDKSE